MVRDARSRAPHHEDQFSRGYDLRQPGADKGGGRLARILAFKAATWNGDRGRRPGPEQQEIILVSKAAEGGPAPSCLGYLARQRDPRRIERDGLGLERVGRAGQIPVARDPANDVTRHQHRATAEQKCEQARPADQVASSGTARKRCSDGAEGERNWDGSDEYRKKSDEIAPTRLMPVHTRKISRVIVGRHRKCPRNPINDGVTHFSSPARR